uniref:Uncharacterized protein n=1 Tax=Micrurus lemniscatus lemniscatus TaxID=129467 RepID=A0A2D4IP29_MICLE
MQRLLSLRPRSTRCSISPAPVPSTVNLQLQQLTMEIPAPILVVSLKTTSIVTHPEELKDEIRDNRLTWEKESMRSLRVLSDLMAHHKFIPPSVCLPAPKALKSI